MLHSRIVSFLLLLGLCIGLAPRASAQAVPQEYIQSFDTTITIEQDTDITIQEKVVFSTTEQKHGIYRYIPYRYTRNSVSHTARITDVTVRDEEGDSYQVEQTKENGALKLQIGDPDRTFTGEKTYVIRYRVQNALQQYESADELYWDITGEGWQFPILATTAHIESKWAKVGALRCFTGVYGSTEQNCSSELNGVGGSLQADSSVLPGENFTIVAQLDRPNQLLFPSQQEKTLASILSNWWIPVLLLPLFVTAGVWIKRGRDWMFLSPNVFQNEENAPQKIKPLLHRFRIPLAYEPFQDLTPAEVGAVENESLEPREIVAEIVDLARKKYLKIESTEKKGFLGTSVGKSVEYTLQELHPRSAAALPKHQTYLLKELFETGDTVTLDDLHGKFTQQWQKFQELVWESVTDKKLFPENPQKVKGIAVGGAIALLSVGFFAAVWIAASWVDSFLPVLLILLQILPVILLALSMPRKTAKGVNIMLQAKGLKATIVRGAWREKIKEKHLFIEEVLPFAVAFGVVHQLAEEMKKLGEEPPRYLGTTHFTAATFSQFAQDFTAQAGSNLTYNPNSSHSSGGSGFSGGGFSGGGGGGGGGGSW